MKHLEAGNPAIPFSATTIDGQSWDLVALQGQPMLINLFRYTGCPLCSLSYWYLIEKYPAWHARGLQVVTVFEAKREDVQRFATKHGMPFPVIADAEHRIYRQYGADTSWWGFFWGFIRRRKNYAESRQRGLANSAINGTINRMPSQFLVTPELTIDTAHYGKDFGDFLAFEAIESFLARYSPTPVTTSSEVNTSSINQEQ